MRYEIGRISPSFDLAKAKAGLAALLEQASEDGPYAFSIDLLSTLTATVNAHEQQLLEVRLSSIVDATERLESRLSRSPSLSALLIA